jgi:AraC-like DNA-binding protein
LRAQQTVPSIRCAHPLFPRLRHARARRFVFFDLIIYDGAISQKGKRFLKSVGTLFRLERSSRAFRPYASAHRKLVPVAGEHACAHEYDLDAWEESSLGDGMHKLVCVVAGQIDLEGSSGGWVIVPNHLVFIPADRPFVLRSAKGTVLHVAHLRPDACEWHHEGCWATPSPPLAREMLRHAVGWTPEQAKSLSVAEHFFAALSHLCREWFSKPRILWLPAARSPEMQGLVTYVREHLADASLKGACTVTGLSPRTLQRRCVTELGFGWRGYLSEARILRGMELLAQGENSVGSVAQRVGFNSLSAFTLAFSKRAGLSPSEFSKQNGVVPSGSTRTRRASPRGL